ncbi:MAG: DUF2231 domain-containing protein [Deltaproteobacteria bacterium]|nr:DUF2231 domain-containing protein [Deltaproteobacteria bacterium]
MKRRTIVRLLLPALVLATAAGAAAQDGEIVLDDEDFEVIEDVEVEDEQGQESGEDSLGPRRRLGRLHPPLVHFGVAWAVLAFPFALARIRWPSLGRADLVVVALSAAGAGASALTGWLHAPDVLSRPGVEPLVELHEKTALASVGLLAAALVLRLVMEKRDSRPVRAAYLVLLALVMGLVLYVGHLGGEITFGEGFLTP